MSTVRAIYASDPSLVAEIQIDAMTEPPSPIQPTPFAIDFVEWVDNTLYKSEALVEDGLKQLLAPVSTFLPVESTPAEEAEKNETKKWMG